MYDKELFEKLNNRVDQYIKSSNQGKVVNYYSAEKLQELLDLELPADSQPLSSLIEVVDNYLNYCVNTNHPQFNNQLYAGIQLPALVAEIISNVTNTSMATFEIAPLATLIEKRLVEKLNSYIGYTDGEGIMLTGGSNANMMAIHCARNRYDRNSKLKGNGSNQYVIFVSELAHYSFEKAMNLMGLGVENIIHIKTNDKGETIPSDLENKIIDAKNEGKVPLLIGSTAGSTVQGSFDPVDEIQDIADKYNLWHHIDGAWGAPILLSKKYKHLLKGCERSDSFAWDTHKLMGTGIITSFYLSRDKGTLEESNSTTGGSKYLFHDYENESFDTGKRSLQCGRKVDSLKLWFTWKILGDKGFEELVDSQMEKSAYFLNKIKNDSDFKVLYDPYYLNVCFQMVPPEKVADLSRYNFELRFHIVRSGEFLLNFARNSQGQIFFRHVFANTNVSYEDIDNLISHLKQQNQIFKLKN